MSAVVIAESGLSYRRRGVGLDTEGGGDALIFSD